MAAGRPVIAYAAGGVLDTVVPGTGVLFGRQTVESIMEAVTQFDPDSVDTSFIRRHAEKFDRHVFRQQMSDFIEQKLDARKTGQGGTGRDAGPRSGGR